MSQLSGKYHCLLCEKEIEQGQKKQLVAIERPVRFLVFFHFDCIQGKDDDFINSFLTKTYDRWYNWYEQEYGKSSGNRGKTNKK